MRTLAAFGKGAAILVGCALSLSASLPAQQRPVPAPTPTSEPIADDIVVTGLRDIHDPKSPVTHATLGSAKVGSGAARSRGVFSQAERFARCAVKPGMRARDELRGALDGVINGARQSFQQKRFVQINAVCAPDVDAAQREGYAAVASGYDTRYYDRGALFIAALNTFAPGLALTKAQTADRAVQARFNAREEALARFRLAADRAYFEMAVCLVRLQPELSLRLIRTNDVAAVGRVEAAIVNGARVCTGYVRKVYFDPTQFRFYIADAVYRWAVAARNVDSLIPAV